MYETKSNEEKPRPKFVWNTFRFSHDAFWVKGNRSMKLGVAVEQQISPSVTATVNYIGNLSLHMINHTANYNAVQRMLTSIGYLFPLPGTGTKVSRDFRSHL